MWISSAKLHNAAEMLAISFLQLQYYVKCYSLQYYCLLFILIATRVFLSRFFCKPTKTNKNKLRLRRLNCFVQNHLALFLFFYVGKSFLSYD